MFSIFTCMDQLTTNNNPYLHQVHNIYPCALYTILYKNEHAINDIGSTVDFLLCTSHRRVNDMARATRFEK